MLPVSGKGAIMLANKRVVGEMFVQVSQQVHRVGLVADG